MKYTSLGRSGLDVSRICLGTMTWGEQNTEAEAFEQMSYALEQGVNFWDTAEVYSVPPKAETYGHTEQMIGNYLQQNKVRDKIVLMSKVVGRTPHARPDGYPPHHHGFTWIREGQARHDRANIMAAIDATLQRLKTDYIDVYQLHWPDRPGPRFGIRDFFPLQDDMVPDGNYNPLFIEVMTVMQDLIKAGKIRHWGLSNETAWGVMKYTFLAEQNNLPKPVSVQNPYSLLDRRDETAMAEVCLRENIAHLPYSPLGAGALSGKYLHHHWPEKARFTLQGKKGRYHNPNCEKAIAHYIGIARQHNLDPCQMALAFCLHQQFVTAPIIGATSMEQLKSNIAAHAIALPDAVIHAINAIHNDSPNPGP